MAATFTFMKPPSTQLSHVTLLLRRRAHLARRQRERQVLTRIVAAAERYDDVLTAVGTAIRHRRAALLCRHPHGADFLAGFLIVRTEHRAARMIRRRRHLRIAEDHERLRHDEA